MLCCQVPAPDSRLTCTNAPRPTMATARISFMIAVVPDWTCLEQASESGDGDGDWPNWNVCTPTGWFCVCCSKRTHGRIYTRIWPDVVTQRTAAENHPQNASQRRRGARIDIRIARACERRHAACVRASGQVQAIETSAKQPQHVNSECV